MPAKRQATAFSYVRFSHPEQGKGDSLRRQAALRDAWCERNGVTLDTSVSLADKGVNGFTGAHRKNPDRHALAAFLELARQGRVPKGSYLIVENLDRLSREDIRPALTLFLQLLDHGVNVVQLEPETVFRHDKTDPFDLMRAIMELSRGHSESAMKSVRVGEAWAAKKKRAAEGGVPLTKLVPAWLKLEGGKFVVREEAARAVRLIFRLATDGLGVVPITRKLNAEKVPPIGTAKHWAYSYVAKVLGSRAAMGEYTPRRYEGKHKVVGSEPPIPDYFPVVVTEQQWYATRAAIDQRRRKRGRDAVRVVNLYSGLLRDAIDGGSVHLDGHSGVRYLSAYNAKIGTTEGSVRFPFVPFDNAVLSLLREIDPEELLPREGGDDEAEDLAGRRAELEAKIAKLSAALEAEDEEVAAAVAVLRRHEAELKKVADEEEATRLKAATPLSRAWRECKSLLGVLESAPDRADARLRLRGILRRVVDGVWCLFAARGRYRMALVQVWFAGGRNRVYLICYDPGCNNPKAKKPTRWWARSVAYDSKAGKIDLRDRRQAAKAAKELAEELEETDPKVEGRR
jgi:DNA invertase Pin-like site-specific DNA recombinase